jgi:hypothetical protein
MWQAKQINGFRFCARAASKLGPCGLTPNAPICE